jgi:hypothetical protein
MHKTTDSTIVFNNFNSTSTDKIAAERFLGANTSDNRRVFLTIACIQGFDIQAFSAFAQEAEVLLPPGSIFLVTSQVVSGSRLDLHLQQLPPHRSVNKALGTEETQATDIAGFQALQNKNNENKHRTDYLHGAMYAREHMKLQRAQLEQEDARGLQRAHAAEALHPTRCGRKCRAGLADCEPLDLGNGSVYALGHGAKYAIEVTNGFDCRASMELRIDGYYMGGWVLESGESMTIEHPSKSQKCFTFLQASHAAAAEFKSTEHAPCGTGIQEHRQENGLVVECRFTPEIRPGVTGGRGDNGAGGTLFRTTNVAKYREGTQFRSEGVIVEISADNGQGMGPGLAAPRVWPKLAPSPRP